jgi:hypothetical protein
VRLFRSVLLISFILLFTPFTVHSLVQLDSNVVFNTSDSNSTIKINETGNFTKIRPTGSAVEFFGPDGTINFNISTSLNVSFRDLNVSEYLNVTLKYLFWDNTTAFVNATVRGFQPDRTITITYPDGTTNATSTPLTEGLLEVGWQGSTNQTNFTFNYSTPSGGDTGGGSGPFAGPGGGGSVVVKVADEVNETLTGISEAVANITLFNEAKILYFTDDWNRKYVCKILFGSLDSCKKSIITIGRPYEIAGLVYSTTGSVRESNYTWSLLNQFNETLYQFHSSVGTIAVSTPGNYTLHLSVVDSTGRVFNATHSFYANFSSPEEAGLFETFKNDTLSRLYNRPIAPGVESSPSTLVGKITAKLDAFFFRISLAVPDFMKFSATGSSQGLEVQEGSPVGSGFTEQIKERFREDPDLQYKILLVLLIPLGLYLIRDLYP